MKSTIKTIILIIVMGLTIVGCKEEEPIQPTTKQPTEVITFKITGLSDDVSKQVLIMAGGFLLDTVIRGNLTYTTPVTQRNMYCKLQVKSNSTLLDALSIEGQGMTVRRSTNCPWYTYDIEYVFIY